MTKAEWKALYEAIKVKLDEAIPMGTPCGVVVLIASEEDGIELQRNGLCVHEAERLCRTAAEFYGEKAAHADHEHTDDEGD